MKMQMKEIQLVEPRITPIYGSIMSAIFTANLGLALTTAPTVMATTMGWAACLVIWVGFYYLQKASVSIYNKYLINKSILETIQQQVKDNKDG